jgi:uncharacterized protein (TIGR01777 family)
MTSTPRVAVAGASGFIGRALSAALHGRGCETVELVRRAPARGGEIGWSPAAGTLPQAGLRGVDAVVVLSGENIAGGRWTAERKRRLRESRVKSLGLVARTLAEIEGGPRTLVAASAIGYYGDRGDEVLTEESAPGKGFLPGIVCEWEAAALPAKEAGLRVVHLRYGLVLDAAGGLLGQLLPLYRLGLGGPLGDGGAYMSWVSLRDAVGATVYALENESLAGPVNVTAPEPVTNAEFTRALGRALGRPTLLRVPAFALRLALGTLADEAILASTRALPVRLEESGFGFADPRIDTALEAILAQPTEAA